MTTAAAELARLAALWDQRAFTHGKRCVVDLGAPESEYDSWTAAQSDLLFNIFPHSLLPKDADNLALDFGCGPGRFSHRLSREISGRVIAYDPCEALVEQIPSDSRVVRATGPFEQFSRVLASEPRFDVIWITLVLGGLPNVVLQEIMPTLVNALAPGGFVFMAEHTHPTHTGSDFWRFRPVDFYVNLLKPLRSRVVGEYVTRGNVVSVFVGRV